MKNIFKKMVIAPALVLIASFTYQAKAQQSIQEVKVIAGDNFTELRKLLNDNFDFTNLDSNEGLVKTKVMFNISKEGKIVNVHASGDCPQVSSEIQNVLSHLVYRIKPSKATEAVLATNYIMPVDVLIRNR